MHSNLREIPQMPADDMQPKAAAAAVRSAYVHVRVARLLLLLASVAGARAAWVSETACEHRRLEIRVRGQGRGLRR